MNGYSGFAHAFKDFHKTFDTIDVSIAKTAEFGFAKEFLENISYDTEQDCHKQFVAQITDTEEEEEDNDETLYSSPKNLNYGGFTTAVFYTISSGHFLSEFGKTPVCFKSYFFTSPYKRYIRYQVFRI